MTLASLWGASTVCATENSGDNIGKGSEGFYAGAIPSQGFYGVLYTNYYTADRYNNGKGRSAIANFHLTVDAVAARLFYQSNLEIAGGKVGFFAIGSGARIASGDASSNHSIVAMGDVTLGSTVGWQRGDWHTLAAFDLVVPKGSYDVHRALNTGNNYYSFRPIFSVSYLPASGWELSAKVTYTFNFRNADTDYRSGQLFHFDYSASYAVTPALRVGLNGYVLKQTTDDRQYGAPVNSDGNRARVVSIGPAARYQLKGASVEVKALREFSARNHSEGESVWAKIVVPL
nr:transporter [Dyella sp. ASV21]